MELVFFVVKAPAASGLIGQSRTFTAEGGTLGRADNNSWVLPDPQRYVSSVHARIDFAGGQFFVVDKSTNGIYINGSPIPLGNNNRHALKSGDTLTFGEYELHASLQESAAPLPDDLGYVDFLDKPAAAAPLVAPAAVGNQFDSWLDGPAAKPATSAENDAFFKPKSASELFGSNEELDPLAALDRKQSGAAEAGKPQQDWLGNDAAAKGPEADAWWQGSVGDNMSMSSAMETPGVIPDDWDDDLLGGKPAAPPKAPTPTSPVAPKPESEPKPKPKPQEAPVAESKPVSAPAAPATSNDWPEDAWTESAQAAAGSIPAWPDAADANASLDVASSAAPVVKDEPSPLQQPRAESMASSPAVPQGAAPKVQMPVDAGQVEQLMAALGLSHLPEPLRQQLIPTVGSLLHEVVEDLMQILRGRAAIKNEFRMSMTTIQAKENNPLKFAATADEALENMFLKSGRGYLTPDQSFKDAFRDLGDHQIALLEGMRTAYNGVFKMFDPARLQERFDKQKSSAGLLAGGKKARYWEAFAEYYEELSKDADVTFQRLFGEDFAQAYEMKMVQLKRNRSKE